MYAKIMTGTLNDVKKISYIRVHRSSRRIPNYYIIVNL